MSTKTISVIPVLAAALLATGCQTISDIRGQNRLSANEVRQQFVGRTVESYNLNNQTTSYTYYRPDGKALQVRKNKRRKGVWSIRNNGEICLDFTGLKCRHIVERNGSYYKVRQEGFGISKRIILYKAFRKGNRL